MALKRCSKCSEDKPLADFYKQGRAGYCIPCEKAYKREHYTQNAERIKARTRDWTAANRGRKRLADIAYVAANREKVAARRREYQLAHPEDCLRRSNESRQRNIATYRAREADYRERHRVLCNERIKEWKQRNPHACVMYASKRRAAEIQALPSWADLDAIAVIYKDAQACGLSVDHTVPLLSEFVCGLHCEANLQLLTLADNSRKNNRHWPDMW